MRVAVVDIGTNSTRLLVARVENQRVAEELARESIVTRLGQGVDATGALADEAMERVFAVLDRYTAEMRRLNVERNVAVLTSAVRDASNGDEFTRVVRERYGLDARTLSGDEEAALTYLGATDERDPAEDRDVVVIDIGGGSTEIVAGRAGDVTFFVSMQVGVVRHTERHLHSDPPTHEELSGLAAEVEATIHEQVPAEVRERVEAAVAVAGTATSAASIELELEPYDPDRVHGHVLELGSLDARLARLAMMTVEERRHVVGLHPDRAPTIVAGFVILIEVLRAFGLEEVEISEHDILRGGAVGLVT